jgi:hypothetical protein
LSGQTSNAIRREKLWFGSDSATKSTVAAEMNLAIKFEHKLCIGANSIKDAVYLETHVPRRRKKKDFLISVTYFDTEWCTKER